jgi:serine/threonine protein kinase
MFPLFTKLLSLNSFSIYKIMKPNLDIKIAGKYRTIRKIGAGSFGEIYLAYNMNSGEQYAVKLVNASPGKQKGTPSTAHLRSKGAQTIARRRYVRNMQQEYQLYITMGKKANTTHSC